MSCRTGPLRVARAFARLFKLCGQNPKRWPSRWSGSSFSDQREDHKRPHQQNRYTCHEVAAPRAVGWSGRTWLQQILRMPILP